VQQDKQSARPDGDLSPDRDDRIQDFLARHGGSGPIPRRGERASTGDSGWYEVYAADGHKLRCEWSRIGEREELKFSEVAPRVHGGGKD
jgi:hypothetical protein